MKFALILVPEKEVKLLEKQEEKPVNWKEDSKLEDIVKFHYQGPDRIAVANQRVQLLKNNDLFTLTDWKKLTEEEKDKDGYPRGLRKMLDEAGEGILNFS